MAALTSAPLVALLVLSSWALVRSYDLHKVIANPGAEASLQCRGPRDAEVIEMSRADLEPDDYVFYFREKRPYEAYQHPSYRGRVELRDPEIEDGHFSVILKNVTVTDTGRYECRVSAASSRRRKRSTDEIKSIIELTVTDQGLTQGGRTQEERNKAESHGLVVGLSVIVPLVVVVVGFYYP